MSINNAETSAPTGLESGKRSRSGNISSDISEDSVNRLRELLAALQAIVSIEDITEEYKDKLRGMVGNSECEYMIVVLTTLNLAFRGFGKDTVISAINSILKDAPVDNAPLLKGFYGVRVKTVDDKTRRIIEERHVTAVEEYITPKTNVGNLTFLEQNVVIAGESGSGKTTMAICHPWFNQDRQGDVVIYFCDHFHEKVVNQIKKDIASKNDEMHYKGIRNSIIAEYVFNAALNLVDSFSNFILVFDEVGKKEYAEYVKGILSQEWADIMRTKFGKSKIQARAIVVGTGQDGTQHLVGSMGVIYSTVRMIPWTIDELKKLVPEEVLSKLKNTYVYHTARICCGNARFASIFSIEVRSLLLNKLESRAGGIISHGEAAPIIQAAIVRSCMIFKDMNGLKELSTEIANICGLRALQLSESGFLGELSEYDRDHLVCKYGIVVDNAIRVKRECSGFHYTGTYTVLMEYKDDNDDVLILPDIHKKRYSMSHAQVLFLMFEYGMSQSMGVDMMTGELFEWCAIQREALRIVAKHGGNGNVTLVNAIWQHHDMIDAFFDYCKPNEYSLNNEAVDVGKFKEEIREMLRGKGLVETDDKNPRSTEQVKILEHLVECHLYPNDNSLIFRSRDKASSFDYMTFVGGKLVRYQLKRYLKSPFPLYSQFEEVYKMGSRSQHAILGHHIAKSIFDNGKDKEFIMSNFLDTIKNGGFELSDNSRKKLISDAKEYIKSGVIMRDKLFDATSGNVEVHDNNHQSGIEESHDFEIVCIVGEDNSYIRDNIVSYYPQSKYRYRTLGFGGDDLMSLYCLQQPESVIRIITYKQGSDKW